MKWQEVETKSVKTQFMSDDCHQAEGRGLGTITCGKHNEAKRRVTVYAQAATGGGTQSDCACSKNKACHTRGNSRKYSKSLDPASN